MMHLYIDAGIGLQPRDGEVENNGAIYIYIVKLAAGYTLKANAAYMVKPHANYGQCDFVVEDNPVLYAPVDETSSRKHLETSEYSYDFYGNYATKYFENAYEVYWMGGGSLRPNAAKKSIGSYRWYIKRTGKESTDAKSSFVFVEDNNETTKITNVETIDSDEIDGIYSSNGVKLDTPQKIVKNTSLSWKEADEWLDMKASTKPAAKHTKETSTTSGTGALPELISAAQSFAGTTARIEPAIKPKMTPYV